jgi:LPXTG-motif cell wall-anchored protein
VVEVKPGQEPVCLLEGTPLESCIGVAAGAVTEGEDGAVTATADAVSLHLLKGLPEAGEDAGVRLALAHAEAGIAGVPEVRVQAAPPPAAPQELPRTGGSALVPWLGAGLLALAAAGRLLVGRRSA